MGTDVVIHSIHYTFAPEDADEAEALLRELRDAAIKEDGIISLSVGRSAEHPNVFALWEVYRDNPAFETHAATEPFKRLVIDGVRKMAQQRLVETVFPI